MAELIAMCKAAERLTSSIFGIRGNSTSVMLFREVDRYVHQIKIQPPRCILDSKQRFHDELRTWHRSHLCSAATVWRGHCVTLVFGSASRAFPSLLIKIHLVARLLALNVKSTLWLTTCSLQMVHVDQRNNRIEGGEGSGLWISPQSCK